MDDTKKMILGIAATVVAIIVAQVIMKKLNMIKLQKQEMQYGSDLYQ
jgi:hypothetical protein